MKTKTIKTDAELCEAIGVPNSDGFAELIFRDGTVVGARVGMARFELASYSFSAVRVIDREEVEKYRVRVDHPAFPALNRYFDSEHESREFARPYESIDGAKVDAKKVTVQIDDQGKVLAELDDEGELPCPLAPQDNGGDEIPF